MRKTRLILGCLAVVAILAGLTGCMLPDYQLTTDVGLTGLSGGAVLATDSVTVTYDFKNVGTKDLSNVQVGIEVWRIDGGGVASSTTYVLGPFSIGTGSTNSGTVNFSWLNDGDNSSFDVFITSVGWDADN
jgi:hypothetical protein